MESSTLKDHIISPGWKLIIRMVLGIIILLNVAARIYYSWNTEVSAFYYFTVQSNILCALYWVTASTDFVRRRPLIPLAVTLYMMVTGLVFSLLLDEYFTGSLYDLLAAGEISQTIHYYSLQISGIAHYIMPVLIFFDFLLLHDCRKLRFRSGLKVLLYPLAYFVFHLSYTLTTGGYLYGFLHPEIIGSWGMVALAAFIILGAMTGLIWILLRLNGRIQGKMERYYQGIIDTP